MNCRSPEADSTTTRPSPPLSAVKVSATKILPKLSTAAVCMPSKTKLLPVGEVILGYIDSRVPGAIPPTDTTTARRSITHKNNPKEES